MHKGKKSVANFDMITGMSTGQQPRIANKSLQGPMCLQ